MKKNKKAIASIVGVVLLALLYLLTLITAFLNIPNWERLFQISLAATIALPILLWIFIMLSKK